MKKAEKIEKTKKTQDLKKNLKTKALEKTKEIEKTKKIFKDKENDIERLTNHSLITIFFLIAIVSSTLSALVVARFFDKNPQEIVNTTVNRITEKIIEVESEPSIIHEKETYLISESEIVVRAIEKNKNIFYDFLAENNSENEENSEEVILLENSLAYLGNNIFVGDQIFYDVFSFSTSLKNSEEKIIFTENLGSYKNFNFYKTENFSENVFSNGSARVGESVVFLYGDGAAFKTSIKNIFENGEFEVFPQVENFGKIAYVINLKGEVLGISFGGQNFSIGDLSDLEFLDLQFLNVSAEEIIIIPEEEIEEKKN